MRFQSCLKINSSFFLVDYTCQRTTESSGQDVIYFQNEDYPQASQLPSMCIFSINIKDDTICQLRLDFTEFQLDGGSAINKPCDRDSMEIFTGSSNDLGNGRLCGLNTGQHLYIPVSEGPRSRPMIRVLTDGRLNSVSNSTSLNGYKFRIKIRQIDCTSKSQESRDLIAPEGCLQYFTDRQGTINSFNWDPNIKRQYLPNQHYSICFRQNSFCRLELKRSASAPAFSTSVGQVAVGNFNYGANCGPDNGCGATDCNKFPTGNGNSMTDFIFVAGAYRKSATSNVNNVEMFVVSSYYCGSGIGRDKTDGTTNAPSDGLDDGSGIVSDGPFTVTFRSDNFPAIINPDTSNNMMVPSNAQSELGFSYDYRLLTSCPDLTFANPT